MQPWIVPMGNTRISLRLFCSGILLLLDGLQNLSRFPWYTFHDFAPWSPSRTERRWSSFGFRRQRIKQDFHLFFVRVYELVATFYTSCPARHSALFFNVIFVVFRLNLMLGACLLSTHALMKNAPERVKRRAFDKHIHTFCYSSFWWVPLLPAHYRMFLIIASNSSSPSSSTYSTLFISIFISYAARFMLSEWMSECGSVHTLASHHPFLNIKMTKWIFTRIQLCWALSASANLSATRQFGSLAVSSRYFVLRIYLFIYFFSSSSFIRMEYDKRWAFTCKPKIQFAVNQPNHPCIVVTALSQQMTTNKNSHTNIKNGSVGINTAQKWTQTLSIRTISHWNFSFSLRISGLDFFLSGGDISFDVSIEVDGGSTWIDSGSAHSHTKWESLRVKPVHINACECLACSN